jgi:enterochelin esterase family protein
LSSIKRRIHNDENHSSAWVSGVPARRSPSFYWTARGSASREPNWHGRSAQGTRHAAGAQSGRLPTSDPSRVARLYRPDLFAKADVPHGKIEQANYKNYAGEDKRMHVYLPPDYAGNAGARYPVLYLNHGGGDDDSKWTSEDPRSGGYADDILDNLIAAGKAKPIIIVMPNTRGCATFDPSPIGADDKCSQEYLKDIIPYVDSHYRTKASREYRALAGLSMGGMVVIHTGFQHLDTFSELYIYSSGHINEATLKKFDDYYGAMLKDPATNDKFRVPLYMAAGETDIALYNGQKDLALFDRYGLRNFWVLSSGGHEWANWRRYLYQTAQIMFPDCPAK